MPTAQFFKTLRVHQASLDLQNEFGSAAEERRRCVRERALQDPSIMLPVFTTLVGPDNIPAEMFDDAMRPHLLGETQVDTDGHR